MAKEKTYIVAPGKAVSCKNGLIDEGEKISWRNMPDPLCKKGQDKLGEEAVNDLKKKNFKALLNSEKALVIEKKEAYSLPDEPPEPPADDKPPEDPPAANDKEPPADGAKRKKKKD